MKEHKDAERRTIHRGFLSRLVKNTITAAKA